MPIEIKVIKLQSSVEVLCLTYPAPKIYSRGSHVVENRIHRIPQIVVKSSANVMNIWRRHTHSKLHRNILNASFTSNQLTQQISSHVSYHGKSYCSTKFQNGLVWLRYDMSIAFITLYECLLMKGSRWRNYQCPWKLPEEQSLRINQTDEIK